MCLGAAILDRGKLSTDRDHFPLNINFQLFLHQEIELWPFGLCRRYLAACRQQSQRKHFSRQGKTKQWLFASVLQLWEVLTQYKQRTGFRHPSSDELEQKLLTSCRNESSELGFEVLYRTFFSSLSNDPWCGRVIQSRLTVRWFGSRVAASELVEADSP